MHGRGRPGRESAMPSARASRSASTAAGIFSTLSKSQNGVFHDVPARHEGVHAFPALILFKP